MRTASDITKELIAESIAQTKIAHHTLCYGSDAETNEYNDEIEAALKAAAEDCVINGGRLELWGTDDGAEWRVHLHYCL